MASSHHDSSFGSNLINRLRHLLMPGLLLLFLGLSVYLVFNRDSGLLLILDLKDERDRLQHEVERLKTEKTELEHQIQRLEAVDPMVIEEEARRKGMVREGEEVYRLKYQELPDSGKVDKRPQTLEGR